MTIRVAGVLALVALSVAFFALGPRDIRGPSVHVAIPSGAGATTISARLREAGVIRSAFAFRWYAVLTGNAKTLQAGDYVLCSCDSVPEILRAITSGDALSTDIVVTIPEGSNMWEVDDILSKAHLVASGLFARHYQANEGRIFPDTYRFDRNLASHSAELSTIRAIAQPLMETFQQKASGYTEEQRIIASILEKEAKTAEDMALVSGIIQNRLEHDMPLQIDATVAYGWCLRRWLPMSSMGTCDVTQAPIATEIKVDGAYNTYTRRGLPAAPISNPGLQALEAAAHPQPSDYFYYLSTRDGSQIIYAKTLAEHLKNRQKYLGL